PTLDPDAEVLPGGGVPETLRPWRQRIEQLHESLDRRVGVDRVGGELEVRLEARADGTGVQLERGRTQCVHEEGQILRRLDVEIDVEKAGSLARALFRAHVGSITRFRSSTRSSPLDASRRTSTLSQGSRTTAHRPIWMSNGPLRTVPPAAVN